MDSATRVYYIKPSVVLLMLFCLGCTLFLLVGCRLGYLSSMHLAQGTKAIKAGDHKKASDAFLWAIRNHFPGNPYSTRAVANAMDVIAYYRQKGMLAKEKEALQNIRASLYSIRSFYQPFTNKLERIEERLLQLNGNKNEP